MAGPFENSDEVDQGLGKMLGLWWIIAVGIWSVWLILIAVLFFGNDEETQRILVIAAAAPVLISRIVRRIMDRRRMRFRNAERAEGYEPVEEKLADLNRLVRMEEARSEMVFQERLARHNREKAENAAGKSDAATIGPEPG
jgi:hypothetical protein